MSPILLRPIREQQEHDRVARQLVSRWRRRFEVGVNQGSEEVVPVRSGTRTCYPDLVLTATVSGRRQHGVVEVETASSVNHLEAMAQWTHFAKVRGAFYLYVPAGMAEVAQRLCAATKINVTEIWVYYAIGNQPKFSISYRSPRAKSAAKAARLDSESRARRKKAKGKGAAKAVKRVKKASKKSSKKVPARKTSPAKGSSTRKAVKKTSTRKVAGTTTRKTVKAAAKRARGTSVKRKSVAGRKK